MTQNPLDEDENKHDNPRTNGNLTAFYFRQSNFSLRVVSNEHNSQKLYEIT